MNPKLKIFDRTHLMASFEARGDHALTGYAGTMLKPLQHGLSAFVGLFAPSQSVIALKSNTASFLKLVKTVPYTDIRDYQVYVPEGLKLGYRQYLDMLEPAIQHAAKVPTVMADFSTYLALLIHRPDATKETKSFLNEYGKVDAAREALLTGINSCFNAGLNATQQKLGNVIENNSQWEGILNRLAIINQLMGEVSHKELDKKLEEIMGLLSTLRRQIEVEKKDVSPETLTNLSSGTYLVAKELEFYAAMWYRLESLNHAIDATLLHIRDLETH